MLYCIAISLTAKRSAMRLHAALIAGAIVLQRTLCHHRMTDDKRRTLLFHLRFLQRATNFVDIIAIDLNDVPIPGLVFHSCVLSHHILCVGGELHSIRVIEHDKIVESQSSGNAAHALRNLLFYGAIRDVAIDGVLHHRSSKASLKEFFGHCCTGGDGMTLSQWT